MQQEYPVQGQVRGSTAFAHWGPALPDGQRLAQLSQVCLFMLRTTQRGRSDAHRARLTVGTGGVTGTAARARRTREPNREHIT